MSIGPRRVLVAAGVLALVPGLLHPVAAAHRTATAPVATSTRVWAPAATADIRPGVQTLTEGGQCTANFVFTDAAGAVYLGQAAHCAAAEGGATDINGCLTGSKALGTPVKVQGASRPGTLAYSSWLTMQARQETDENACRFNDFALVKLDPADVPSVNPSVPVFGGPTGLNTTGTTLGDAVYSYGNSSLRQGLTLLSPKRGISIGDQGAGWTHLVYTLTPGIPGDSGSGFMDARGNALGVLATLAVLPFVGSNGVTDMNLALDYLNRYSGMKVTLVPGTQPFSPGLGLLLL